MKSNTILCDHCFKEIESIDALTLCKSTSIHFKKFHTECYAPAAEADRIKLSRPINFSTSVMFLSVVNLAILAFIIFTNEKRMVFVGILMITIVFIDLPYYFMWKNVVKPLHDQSTENK